MNADAEPSRAEPSRAEPSPEPPEQPTTFTSPLDAGLPVLRSGVTAHLYRGIRGVSSQRHLVPLASITGLSVIDLSPCVIHQGEYSI
ncbi:hypothetical protein EYF80_061715 [Liparis tanakae]|uniref:Uncharacterized protein n=1 Tax=Liparis tanakae TaxID=230148 RepID=A0A4Z2EHB0_9TELE|nr:hypothetical protein EYF80_061715 [Liparis tanakae]